MYSSKLSLTLQKENEYIDLNANKSDNKNLKNVAAEIEDLTTFIFVSLNDILHINTKILRNKK